MKVKVQLQVLHIEDAEKAEKVLQSLGVATNGIHSQVISEVSAEQWKEMDEYQEDPNLPRFMYPEWENHPGLFWDDAIPEQV